MKVLVVRNDRLGDMLLALPAARLLKQAGHQAALLASPYTAPLARRSPDLDLVLEDGPGILPRLKAQAFDAALVLWAKPRNAWLCLAAGIPARIGISGRWHSLLYSRRLGLRRSRGERHESELNADFARALGIGAGEAPPPRLALLDADRAEADACLDSLGLLQGPCPLVMLHPGMGGSALNWAAAHYAELAAALRARLGARVLFTGGPAERPGLAALAGSAPGAQALDRDLSLPAFAALLSRARLFASGSTGPMHVAAAVGAPTLSFFPPVLPMSPLRWASRGSLRQVLSPSGLGVTCPRCRGQACPFFDCMDRITVEGAVAAAEVLLK
jgi:ADP-heptose:LPS heptosyltransferase